MITEKFLLIISSLRTLKEFLTNSKLSKPVSAAESEISGPCTTYTFELSFQKAVSKMPSKSHCQISNSCTKTLTM